MRERILSYLNSCEPDMFTLLKSLVLQESFTLDKSGVDTVGHLLQNALKDCALTLEREKRDDLGDHLIFRSTGCSTRTFQPILMAGHMDTVYPREMMFNRYHEDETRAYGPGVIDMKGGLVAAVFTLKALSMAGLLEEIPIIFICNSDEEKGSLTSKEILRREASKSLIALVFECGGPEGEVVTGRRGKIGYHIEITGQAGHAAFAGKNKASSILELAHKIISLEQLNNPERQIVVNVGQIKGGIGPNTVAERAEAHVDCRFSTEKDGQYCRAQIERIIHECTVPRTGVVYKETSSRAVMEPKESNRKLFQIFRKQAELINLAIKEENRPGVSDANTLASCGLPVLDGLGPIGKYDHSEKEYMIKQSLPARTKLAALSLLEIYQQQIKTGLFSN